MKKKLTKEQIEKIKLEHDLRTKKINQQQIVKK